MKVLILVFASVSVVHCGLLGAASLFGSNGLFGFDNEEEEAPLNTEAHAISSASLPSGPPSPPQMLPITQPSFPRSAGGGHASLFSPPSRPASQYIPPPNPAYIPPPNPAYIPPQRPSSSYGAPGYLPPEQSAPPSSAYGAPFLPQQSAPPSSLYGAPAQAPVNNYLPPEQSAPPSQLYGAPSRDYPTPGYLPPFVGGPSSLPSGVGGHQGVGFPGSGLTGAADVLPSPAIHGPPAAPTKKIKTFRIIKETSSARAAMPAKTIRIIKESAAGGESSNIQTIKVVSDAGGVSATRVLRIINEGSDGSAHLGGGATRIVRILREGGDASTSAHGGATRVIRVLSDGGDAVSSSGATQILRIISDGGSSHTSSSLTSPSKTVRVVQEGGSLASGGHSDESLLKIIREHIVTPDAGSSSDGERVLRIVSDGSNSAGSAGGYSYASGLGEEKVLRLVS